MVVWSVDLRCLAGTGLPSLGTLPKREVVHTGQCGLEDSIVPDLEALVIDERSGRIRRALLDDLGCLLVELVL